VTADYTNDGLERLALRAILNMTPPGTTQYDYDLAGHLIAEVDSSGNALTEYVRLDDMPLAVVAGAQGQALLVIRCHADRLLGRREGSRGLRPCAMKPCPLYNLN
jgi:hypothetical protein